MAPLLRRRDDFLPPPSKRVWILPDGALRGAEGLIRCRRWPNG